MKMTEEQKPRSRRLRNLFIAAAIFMFLGGGSLLLQKALRLESYRAEILETLQETLHRRVAYDKGEFSFRLAPSFTFTNILIMERDGSGPFLSAERLTFRIALLPLLERKLVVRGVTMEKPAVTIRRDPSGSLNMGDLLKEKPEKTPLQIRGVTVRKGSLRFVDRGTGTGELVTVVDDLNLSIGRLARGKKGALKLSASLAQGAQNGRITVSGYLTPSDKGKSLMESSFSGSVKAEHLDVGHFWDYYARYVPFRKVLGRVNLDAAFEGRLTSFISKGKVRIAGLRFDYPEVFHGILTPGNLSFSYDMELNPNDVLVKSLNLNVDGLNVKGSCALKEIGSGDIFIDAQAVTSVFRLEDFNRYIPYGVIADDASSYIEQHIKGGLFQLEKGTLKGRVSQIAHMEKGTNYNVLSIKGTVEKGLVTYGPDVPTFNGIRGRLEMRGKDFILSGMRANFGGSPFTLDGRITDYPLTTPSSYPFTMTMKPRPAEIAWLFRAGRSGTPVVSGDSILTLRGSGRTSSYSLAGNWDLSAAAYSWRDLIAKPAGQPNHLSFQAILNATEARVPAFHYDLAPLALSGSAEYRSGGKKALSFTARTNEFQIQELAPRIPRLARYKPAGRVRLAIHGRGEDGKNGPALDGDLFLQGASCVLWEKIAPLTNINGSIGFRGDTIKTSLLTARLGGSTITGTGVLTGFTSPAFGLEFSSPALALSDLGLHAPGKPVTLHKVHGSLEFKGGTLSLRSLSGQLNRSTVKVSGEVNDLRNPKADLVLDAEYLDMEDVALLSSIERGGAGRGGAPRLSLNARLTADAGKFHNVEFRKLKSGIHFEQKILYLEQAACEVMDGVFNGSGRIDFESAGGPRYQTSFSLKNVSASQFLQALGTTREVTGSMTLEGDLTAKGDTLEEVTASSLGNIRLHCEKGSLRKFSLLSKVFSILNVSQLFSFKLPDMVHDGMPFNEVNATFALRDGLVKTEDLFIDSNAMSISIVGEFDLVKKQLSATVGVKPLQTIDKVVSRIPVVGWVLTGKNRSLVTTYFEAKGSLDNPTVRSIAVKSMAKGIFSIFSRLFSLPAKLVTDTGEVIINR